MKKLDVVYYAWFQDRMIMIYHRYNTENMNENSTGMWIALKEFSFDEVVQYANMHVDKDITVEVLPARN